MRQVMEISCNRPVSTGDAAAQQQSYVFFLPWELQLPGGVTEVVLNLYREMAMAGEFKPLVMVSKWSAVQPMERLIDGRPTFYLRFWSPWPGRRSPTGLLKLLLAAPVWMPNLLRFLRHHRVTVFNFHYPLLNCFPLALLRFFRLYRGALVLSFHGLDLHAARKAGYIERALWRFVLRRATAIVACSRALAAEVIEFARTDADHVHVVHNGLDVQKMIGESKRSSGMPEALTERAFILSVATLEHKKGLDVLIRAYANIRDAFPGLALALLGRSASAEPGLRALACELGVADDIHFLGSVPHNQVGKFLKHAKAFCLPSRHEPFGIAILEAGAYRLPVVASRIGGIPEIIDDGATGLLVPPDDPDALAAALNRVLSDTELASVLGESLYRRVCADFSWEKAYQAYRALLT